VLTYNQINVNNPTYLADVLYFILFADDTNLFNSDTDVVRLMKTVNVELIKLPKWFQVNRLSFNVKKTIYILFGYKHLNKNNLNFSLIVNSFLGVNIDNKLNWKKHIEYIRLKISRRLDIMSRVHYLPRVIIKLLYHTLIYPYFPYCNVVWGSAKISVLNKLFVLQKELCVYAHVLLFVHRQARYSLVFIF